MLCERNDSFGLVAGQRPAIDDFHNVVGAGCVIEADRLSVEEGGGQLCVSVHWGARCCLVCSRQTDRQT